MADLSYCGEQVRRHDHDRFLGTLFAPTRPREALQVLFALNVELARIPELVREPMLGRIRQQFWRDSIAGIYAGRTPRDPVGAALAPVIAGFGLVQEDLERMLDARGQDLDEAAPESLAALVAYADATAGTLAAMALTVLGAADPDSRAAARAVGIGCALTALLQSVPAHLRRRRIWLPADLNRAAGLDVFALYTGDRDDRLAAAVAAVVAAVAAEADRHLAQARSNRSRVDRRALPVLLPATIASAGLARLRKARFDPLAPAVAASPPLSRLLRITAAAAVGRY